MRKLVGKKEGNLEDVEGGKRGWRKMRTVREEVISLSAR